MDYEDTARNSHRSGMNCATAVYTAFDGDRSNAPRPRAEGGKCGAILAAEQVIGEKGLGNPAEVEEMFLNLYGSAKCAELRGAATGKCNDYAGTAARFVGERLA